MPYIINTGVYHLFFFIPLISDIFYQVEACRDSQAARIVEEIIISQDRQALNARTVPKPPVTEKTVGKVPFALTKLSLDESFNGIDGETFTYGKAFLTPPSTPNGSLSPYTGSPAASPCPSPRLQRNSTPGLTGETSSREGNDSTNALQDELFAETSHQPIKKFGNQLKPLGNHDWGRKGAIRRHKRSRTVPRTKLTDTSDAADDSKKINERPSVPMRPPKTTHIPKSQSLSHSLSQAFLAHQQLAKRNSRNCKQCQGECHCVLPGPVLPQPIQTPFNQSRRHHRSGVSSFSSGSSVSDDHVWDTYLAVSPSPSSRMSSPNRLQISPKLSPSLSPTHNGDFFFSDKRPPPVPSHASPKTNRSNSEQNGRSRMLVNSEKKQWKPTAPNRVDSLDKSDGCETTTAFRRPLVLPVRRDLPRIREPPSPRPRLTRTAKTSTDPTRMCVLCKGACTCHDKNTSLLEFVTQTIQDENYLAMIGNVDQYVAASDFSTDGPKRKVPPRPAPRRRKPKPIPVASERARKQSKYTNCTTDKRRLYSEDACKVDNKESDFQNVQDSSMKCLTKSFDDLYQLVNESSGEDTCPDCSSYPSLKMPGTFPPYQKKPLPLNTLGMTESSWTEFLLSFDCENSSGFEIGDWRGLAEFLDLSAKDINIVKQHCCKSGRIASEFILLYWSNYPKSKLPYTRQSLLDVLASLDRMDLVEIVQK
ncbi:hypothetical protein BSL78_01335 [Apostichopus japonicus]|uniref:Death domain-containing protein n=1 Tax=Stichopus japonicus TaxID=307972 RepID=A0A2G8LN92_STIJA|nr:hypothetical protein BSL78_01335 [Apostichopus japonicus]